MMSWVYIIKTKTGGYYTGVTNNYVKRMEQHMSGRGAKYTKAHGCLAVVYLEECANKGEAMKKERVIKKLGRREKEKMIFEHNHRALTNHGGK
jgi:putative endonuclease